VIAVLEGWDTAGKGENIALLTEKLDPRHFRVHAIAEPTPEEAGRPFLWRFWRRLPPRGDIALFDRSWYGRVLVERVEGFASEAEWRRAYEEINGFERHLVEYGTVLVKLWLHLSPEEQLRRFEEREVTSYKMYKITPEDWRNRLKWNEYRAAVSEMLERTSTTRAPWTVVEAEDKLWARIKALETVVSAVERRLSR
jgi:polyphosphate kinase 2 (PPK2 family)